MKTPELNTPEDYKRFLESDAGSQVAPGSPEESHMLQGFRDARARAETERVGTPDKPGSLADELHRVESDAGVVDRGDSQAAHHKSIRISHAGPEEPQGIQVRHTPEADADPQQLTHAG